MANEKILVIDDNPTNLKLIAYLLQAEGFNVKTAAEGDEALRLIKSFRPRLVIMDIQLPGRDGLELTRIVRADPENSGTIVLAVTAYAMPGDEQRAREAGCDGYLTKPINTRTLPTIIREYLRNKDAIQQNASCGGNCDLLTELRNNFLIEGEEESRRLLENLMLDRGLGGAQRVAHHWNVLGGTLGFPGIRRQALEIERLLEKPPAEAADRLSVSLTAIASSFSGTLRGKIEVPALSSLALQGLASKSIALVGFEHRESARITAALEQAQSLICCVFYSEASPSSAELQGFDLLVVNVTDGHGCVWLDPEFLAKIHTPLLMVGSRELFLQDGLLFQDTSQDFLISPWDAEELVVRAHRLVSRFRHGAAAMEPNLMPATLLAVGAPAAPPIA